MLTRRKLLGKLLVAGTLAALAFRLDAAELKRWKGKPAAPPVDLLTPEGAPFSLKQLRGKGRAGQLLGDLVRAVHHGDAGAATIAQ